MRTYLTDKNIIVDNANVYQTEPVSVGDLKTFLQLEGDAYNGILAYYITAARKKIENYCDVSLVPKSIKAQFMTMGCSPMTLPFPPFDAIQQVGWKKCPSTWIELDGSSTPYDYTIVNDEGFKVSIQANISGTFRVQYTTKAVADNGVFNMAILMQAGYMYTQRDSPDVPDWNQQAKAMVQELRNGGV